MGEMVRRICLIMVLFSKKLLFILIAVILVAHFIAVWYLLYPKFFWLDIVLHLIGGIAVALFVVIYFGDRLNATNSIVFIIISLIAWTVFAGVLWEFFEWGFDNFVATPYDLPYSQPGLDDTMGDLAMDILGGLVVAILYIKKKKDIGLPMS